MIQYRKVSANSVDPDKTVSDQSAPFAILSTSWIH